MRKTIMIAVAVAVLTLTYAILAWAGPTGNSCSSSTCACTYQDSTCTGVYQNQDKDGVDEDVYEDENNDVKEIRTEMKAKVKNKGEARLLREKIRARVKNPAARLALWEELKAMCADEEEAAATVAEMIYDNPQDKEAYKEFAKLWRKRHKEQVLVFASGQKLTFDVPPQIVRARTLMPIRAVAEKLGADVRWDPKTRTITIRKEEKVIVLVVNMPQAKVDGKEVKLDVPPAVTNGRTMVPLRFVMEHLGGNVTWIQDAQTVVIN